MKLAHNEVGAPDDMRHRKFVKTVLRKRWPGMKDKSNCVYIGSKIGYKHWKEIREWCEDNEGEWHCSPNREKYYFSNRLTAFAFKMRWYGAPTTEEQQ